MPLSLLQIIKALHYILINTTNHAFHELFLNADGQRPTVHIECQEHSTLFKTGRASKMMVVDSVSSVPKQ